jgi:tetratricopeptide (TPR) repeat protein
MQDTGGAGAIGLIDAGSPPAEGKRRRRSARLLTIAIIALIVAILAALGLIGTRIMSLKDQADRAPASMVDRDVLEQQALVREKPDDPQRRVRLAAAYLQAGRPGEALAEAKKVYSADKASVDSLIVMGASQLALGEIDEAQANYEEILKMVNHAVARTRLAQIHLFKSDLEKGAEQLDLALQAEPTASDMLVLRARVYELNHDKEKALEMYERALKYVPGYGPAVEGMSRLENGEWIDSELFRRQMQAVLGLRGQ